MSSSQDRDQTQKQELLIDPTHNPAPNGALKLPDSLGIQVIDLKTNEIYPPPNNVVNNKILPCDVIHLAGITFPNDPDESFLRAIKTQVPKVDFEVKIGSTGYVTWPKADALPSRGWTTDEIGRLVAVIDGKRYFQRYTNNCKMLTNQHLIYPDSFYSMESKDKMELIYRIQRKTTEI